MTPAPRAARTVLGSLVALALDLGLLALGVGGLVPLLHHPRALALFATWLIATPTLAVLRPVRTHAPVAGRPDRLLMVVLFVVPLLTPMLSALAERRGLWPVPGGAALRWGGVVLSAPGMALRIAAMRQLGSRFSPLAAVQPPHTLETGGVHGPARAPAFSGAGG